MKLKALELRMNRAKPSFIKCVIRKQEEKAVEDVFSNRILLIFIHSVAIVARNPTNAITQCLGTIGFGHTNWL